MTQFSTQMSNLTSDWRHCCYYLSSRLLKIQTKDRRTDCQLNDTHLSGCSRSHTHSLTLWQQPWHLPLSHSYALGTLITASSAPLDNSLKPQETSGDCSSTLLPKSRFIRLHYRYTKPYRSYWYHHRSTGYIHPACISNLFIHSFIYSIRINRFGGAGELEAESRSKGCSVPQLAISLNNKQGNQPNKTKCLQASVFPVSTIYIWLYHIALHSSKDSESAIFNRPQPQQQGNQV